MISLIKKPRVEIYDKNFRCFAYKPYAYSASRKVFVIANIK